MNLSHTDFCLILVRPSLGFDGCSPGCRHQDGSCVSSCVPEIMSRSPRNFQGRIRHGFFSKKVNFCVPSFSIS